MVQPINRNDKFLSPEEYDYYTALGLEHLTHPNQSIILYRINKELSDVDDLYHETSADEVYFHSPIEIPAVVKINESETGAYISDKGALRHEEYGNIRASIFTKTLEDSNIEIGLGDYIGYRVKEDTIIYFEVTSPNEKQYDNAKAFLGYKYYWKVFIGTPTQKQTSDFER